VIMLRGPSDSGKTSIALEAVADCLQHNPKKKALVIDFEGGFDCDRLRIELATRGVTDVGDVVSIFAIEEIRAQWNTASVLVFRPPNMETGCEIGDVLLSTGEVSIVVHDSIASMIPEAQADGVSGMGPAARALYLSTWVPRFKQAVQRAGAVGILINHAKKKVMGHKGDAKFAPWMSPGGDSIPFYCEVRLFVRSMKKAADFRTKRGQGWGIKDTEGRVSRITVERNKTSAHRGSEISFLLDDVTGRYDLATSVLRMFADAGLSTERKLNAPAMLRQADTPTSSVAAAVIAAVEARAFVPIRASEE